MSTYTIMKLACIVLVFVAVSAPRAEAETSCGVITQKLAPCLGFLMNGQGPSAGCCNGVRDLKSMIVSTADRRNACQCMKNAAATFPSISPVYAVALPGKCGVNLPVGAGPQTDCSKIN